MAGRTHFPVAGETESGAAKAIFYHCPAPLRPLLMLAAWPVLFRPRIVRAWRAIEPGGPFDLIFGGGQMLSDLALNFPLKFGLTARLAAKRQARIAVNAVGVSPRWSRTATAMFVRALTHPSMRSISVRDEQSHASLTRHAPGVGARCRITVDPGVWAGEVYGLEATPLPEDGRLTIGLGVSDPSELAAYARNPDMFGPKAMLAYWTDLATCLAGQGHRPVLFTNGSEEDEAFLDQVAAALQPLAPAWKRLPRPMVPSELADRMRGLHALISHRLHANIIAFSAGIPSVPLVWDGKVRAFAAVSGRDRWCLGEGATATESAALVIEAAAAGVDPEQRRALKARARNDVQSLLVTLHQGESL